MSENGAALANAEPAVQELTVRDMIGAVARRRRTAALIFLLVLGIGTWMTLTERRTYASAVTVRVRASNQSPLPGVPVTQPEYDFRVDPLVSEQQVIKSKLIATQAVEATGARLAVLKPERVLLSAVLGETTPVVRTMSIDTTFVLTFLDSGYALQVGPRRFGPVPYGTPLDQGSIAITVPERPRIKPRAVTLGLESLDDDARDLQGAITTRVLPQTDIIEITTFGNDPIRVWHLANAVADVYATYSREQGLLTAQARTKFIERSLTEQASQLAKAQDSLRIFQELHQSSDVSAEAKQILNTIYENEGERGKLTLEQRVYEQLVGKLVQTDTTDIEMHKLVGTDAVKNNRAVADLYARWFDLERTRQQLTLTRNDRNRDVQALDSTIAATKNNLQQASGLYLQSLATRIQSIDDNIADLRRQTQRFPPLVAEQARLSGNVHTMETGYDNLLSQFQLSRIGESAETGHVRLIDAAVLPTIPVSPHRKRSVIISALLGLVLGCVGAVLLDRFDDTVQSPDEVRDRLNLVLLGSVPLIRQKTAPDLITHQDPQSVAAESFRSLRTNIAFARAHQDLRTIVVTSATPGEGKSTLAVNLATTFAQQGQKTLLIDADLRRAVLDRTFDIPRSPGLTDVLVGIKTVTEAAKSTDVPHLSIIPSGQFPPNPSELLGSARMRSVIEEATQAFDMVIIDSPPVLAVTDASVLSTFADGTIIVIRMGESTREAVRRSVAQLRVVHGRILGAVLNGVDFRSSAYQGGYGYYYQRFYGDDASKRRGKRRVGRVG